MSMGLLKIQVAPPSEIVCKPAPRPRAPRFSTTPLKFLQGTAVKNIEIIVRFFILYPPHTCHNQETPPPPPPTLWCEFALPPGAAGLLLKPHTISLLLLPLNPQIKDETKDHSFFFLVSLQTPTTFQDLGSHFFSFLSLFKNKTKQTKKEKNVLR